MQSNALCNDIRFIGFKISYFGGEETIRVELLVVEVEQIKLKAIWVSGCSFNSRFYFVQFS